MATYSKFPVMNHHFLYVYSSRWADFDKKCHKKLTSTDHHMPLTYSENLEVYLIEKSYYTWWSVEVIFKKNNFARK